MTKIQIGGQVIDAPETLPDRRFRDAWVLDGNSIVIDPAKQREIFVQAVKAEAARRITAVMPEWRQRNATAWTVEMVVLHGHDRTHWPAETAATQAVIDAAWAAIKAIRARSDQIEAGDILSAEALASDATWA